MTFNYNYELRKFKFPYDGVKITKVVGNNRYDTISIPIYLLKEFLFKEML